MFRAASAACAVGCPMVTSPTANARWAIRAAPKYSTQYTLRDPGELRNYYGMPKNRGESVDAETELVLRRAYFACVSYVDALVGKLLDRVQLDAQIHVASRQSGPAEPGRTIEGEYDHRP